MKGQDSNRHRLRRLEVPTEVLIQALAAVGALEGVPEGAELRALYFTKTLVPPPGRELPRSLHLYFGTDDFDAVLAGEIPVIPLPHLP